MIPLPKSYSIQGVVVRRLERVKETKRAVIYSEGDLMPGEEYLFGPQGQVYLSKEAAGDAEQIVVKVEFYRVDITKKDTP